jgi:hypothetical protein
MGVCKLLQFVFPLWNFPEHSTCAFAPSLIQTDERNKKYHSSKNAERKRKKHYKALFHRQKITQTAPRQKKKAEQLAPHPA